MTTQPAAPFPPADSADSLPCSRGWDAPDTPAWGTASPAAFWLAVEEPGPWGRKAFTQSRLDPHVGARLEKETQAAGGRALLIRSPGDRRDTAEGAPRRVFLAGGMASGQPWLLQGLFVDPGVLLHLPWEAIASADAETARASAHAVLPELGVCATPLLLVCTNGKRDVCCAVRGRALAGYLAGQRGPWVWECTHTGGHRFAPTGVALPSGATYARLDPPLALAAVDAEQHGRIAAGALGERHLRGLAHLSGPEQAADAWVRAACGETSVTALRLAPCGGEGEERTYDVTHVDGRAWRVVVTAHTQTGPPVSCGGEQVASTSYAVREIAT